ncbi:cobyric acid synthase [Desulfohalovibrio reitneri]|uniref:cobyric acid synthase n=1 Tax=Desulfohalovibrio reitneri TaxID=1307759 RepID=UPI0004A6EBA4|nr:cobyric acid synthase [Desulfohalovibrio reitneri]
MDQRGHGGDLCGLAREAGCRPEDITDFSASINPLGPPPWLRHAVAGALGGVCSYPDPEATGLRQAAARRYGCRAGELVAGNGTSDLLFALPRVLKPGRAIIPVPSYRDYEAACLRAGLLVERVHLSPEHHFHLYFALLEDALERGPAVVILGNPNNPTGRSIPSTDVVRLARNHPDSVFVVDEAFADFVPGLARLAGERPDNVVVLLSLTKFYALPGMRLGLAAASEQIAADLAEELPPWQAGTLAQAVGARALADDDYFQRTRRTMLEQCGHLYQLLTSIKGLTVIPSEANFLLCRLDGGRFSDAGKLAGELLRTHRLAIRPCANFPGLDQRYFRVAVRGAEDNERLARALDELAGGGKPRPAPRRTPALMVQATCSNAGKSLLVSALCRILRRRGLAPCPFKAQNMSLNSFVTPDGGEMGRAQALQAQAAGLEVDARMNPVLLKPSSETGSQVMVLGKPWESLRAAEYYRAKSELWPVVTRAYDELATGAGVMVLEGAGSPAEVNLKPHDIVNMAMARHARASVLLASDIDRGGAFASLMGTMDCLEEDERALVAGFVLNKFRGDPALLDGAFAVLREHTGREVLGVVPWLSGLGLPEEDSVSFKAGGTLAEKPGADLDVAIIDLPHVSNFTDLDALAAEPDAALRLVRSPDDLGAPDLLVLPGSKNTIEDLRWLRESGLARAVAGLRGRAVLAGICGGLQMLGQSVDDPLGLESSGLEEGLGVLPLATTLARDKTLTRREATHAATGRRVKGYEIHHGETALRGEAEELFADSPGLGWALPDGSAWGTYLHGVFDADPFRHAVLDDLRARKGLPPLASPRAAYEIESALDRLADEVERVLDMDRILERLGL